MPEYTIERIDGTWCLCSNGIPCQGYTSLAAAKEDNPGVPVIQK